MLTQKKKKSSEEIKRWNIFCRPQVTWAQIK